MSKVNLKKEAAAQADDMVLVKEITEETLLEGCPEIFLKAFKKAKTQGQRADFLYVADEQRLSLGKEVEAMKKFIALLERWFIQELPESDATGVAGKIARIQVKRKERAVPEDWDKLYTHIKKKGEFELLNRALNAKAVRERWEAGIQIPGVGKFVYKDVSVTKV